jgi:hypothetical protein
MKDHTFIAVIIDNSNSMQGQVNETKSCFKKFIKEQLVLNNNASVQITYFNSSCITKPIQPISENLNIDDYICFNMTALYRTLRNRIIEIGNYLNNLQEENRPNKVIVAIITDAKNTIKSEYSQETIIKIIEHQVKKYNWNFLFLNADPTVIKENNEGMHISTSTNIDEAYRSISYLINQVKAI